MFASLFSGIIFLKFLVVGVCFGFAYELCKIFKLIFKNNIYIVNTTSFVYFAVLGLVFASCVLKLCSGQVYLYAFFATIIGILIEQFSIGIGFTKIYSLLYNVFSKVTTKIKNTKLGNKIFR